MVSISECFSYNFQFGQLVLVSLTKIYKGHTKRFTVKVIVN